MGSVGKLEGMRVLHIYNLTRHACLESGFFCIDNMKDHPLDLFKYLRAKT